MGSKKKKGKYSYGIKVAEYGWLLPIVAWTLLSFTKGSYFGKILFSGVLLYSSYFWKKDHPFLAKAILILSACTPWLTLLGLSQRHILLAETVLMYVSIGALLYWNIKFHWTHKQLWGVFFIYLLSLLRIFSRYTYAGEKMDSRYWPIYLSCAIVACVVFGFLTFKDIFYLADDRTSEKIAVCLTAAALGFLLPWTTVNNLNYMLDKSEPMTYELVIDEKDIYSSAKSGDSYYLILNRNGQELKMEVSKEKFDAYDVGDKLPVMLYEGAFDKPYFIIE